jgi:histidinol-phosphate aminotransferase
MAESLGVGKENIILTNGSDEVLNFAFMAYCDNDTPACFADITYGFYKVFADINSVPKKVIPLKDDFSLSVDDYIGQKGTIFIANPNAPTGLLLPLTEIERLLIANKDNMVVIDEAYIDFGGESAVSLIDKYDNLLVTRTFSKSRSMAGARLGFGIANKAVIQDLVSIKYSTNPYNVNRMTASAGYGSIKDNAYFVDNIKKIIYNRDYTVKELKALGFEMTNSMANFIFVRHDKIDGDTLYLMLKKAGILVRHFNDEKIKDYNRITIGSLKQMQTLVATIKNILENSL